MNAMNTQPQGLTRLIFDTLVTLTPEVVASGEHWSPELLERVEGEVRRQLAPTDNGRGNLIFDMVFRRAFAEARALILHQALIPSQVRPARRAPIHALA
jgi:hypothetical protein